MINLIPTDIKEEITYARRNTVLLRWIVSLSVAIVGIIVIVLFGQFYMQQSIKTYSSQLDISKQALKDQKLEETQKRLDEISGSFKLVTQVLSREILFSKLLQQLGAAIPAGVQLSSLQIDKLQGGLSLSAQAIDFQSASQLQLNLQDPKNKIFEKADLESINCSNLKTVDNTPNKYPCTVQIRALFSKDSQFFFINSSSKDTSP